MPLVETQMSYKFRERLKHGSNRMSEVNRSCGSYVGSAGTIPITISPILMSSDELNPGGEPSILRVERQDFVVWVCARGPNGELGLGDSYPPKPGHKILWNNQTFLVSSMGHDEPPYVHVDSDRTRVIIHTIRVALSS
jgi:hypothetical protein